MRSFPVWEEPPRTTGHRTTVRLKSMSIGYTFPKRWMSRAKIGNLRIYVAGTNLFTISKLNKYKLDPEAPSGAGTRYYPLMRTFTIGLNISL